MIRYRKAVLALLAAISVEAAGSAALPGRLSDVAYPEHYEIVVEPAADALTFSGRTTIDIVVREATRTLVLNAADLQIQSAKLDERTDARVTVDSAAETATLEFSEPVGTGRHRLSLDYTGRIFTSATGFFALDYKSAEGPKRVLTTQFEAADARRFAPMWDEPAAKATFDLEVVIPAGQAAFSNMPEASSRIEAGRKHIRFQTTPKMSSYLLHLTVGELERISRKVGGVDVGVVTRVGASDQGRYALDAAGEVLPWFNEYFGTPYPLPKLDMIAVPGSSQFFGAMENWGAILYFEAAVLIDPRLSTESDRQGVYGTVAHEIAHQWFGNLVTMRWWDDLWLNEGFASWMASEVQAALHPEWKPWLQTMNWSREPALRLDARPSTHPVVRAIPSVAAAAQAFDTISYEKGMSVIRMLEDWLGEAAFRDGIRQYMAKYAYSNTVTDQLWAELAAASRQPVMDVARDLTLQPGVPLVQVQVDPCSDGMTRVTLTQQRFNPSDTAVEQMRWTLPVRMRVVGSDTVAQLTLPRDKPAVATLRGCGPVVVNTEMAGYFRTLYSADELARLREAFATLSAADQLGLLSDAWALGEAGLVAISAHPEFAGSVPVGADPLIWDQVAQTFLRIDRTLEESPYRAAWRSLARARLRPVFDAIGWIPSPGQSDTVAILRETLITALGRFDDPEVIKQAQDRLLRSERDAAALPAAIRKPVLYVAAEHADTALWNEIHRRARTSSEPVEQQRLYTALGRPRDLALAQKALDLALSGEPPATIPAGLLESVSIPHPGLAFDFARTHEQQVQSMIEVSSRWRFLPSLADGSSDPAVARRLADYARTSIPADARKQAETVIAGIEYRAKVRAQRVPELESWIRTQHGD